MPANSWPGNDSYDDRDAIDRVSTEINSLLADLSTQEDTEVETLEPLTLPSRFKNRRRKAAIALSIVWTGTIALHLVSWGTLFILGITGILSFQALVLIFTKKRTASQAIQDDYPYVSILVAAKNEESVITNLVNNLCRLEYPEGQYEVWIIDDNSTDKTPLLLAQLEHKYSNLNVLRRSEGARGGKSGALNEVLQLAKGDILAVFDADAKVSADALMRIVPMFQQEKVGAVQMRKAIANADKNFWTKGQAAEMTLDAYMQQQRIAAGGIGELRGNGQFVRRSAIVSCGGWNEETITDDLDLTLRLHLDNWDIESAFFPAVEEEGVTNAIALWHQRNRWAEGGYQRYLDYWDLILKNRARTRKTWDMLLFMFIQYILPTAGVPDLLMAIARHRSPIFAPLTGFSLALSVVWMVSGLKKIQREKLQKQLGAAEYFTILIQTVRGYLYFLHWLVVIASVTARMSVLPKRLKWVKTVHVGDE